MNKISVSALQSLRDAYKEKVNKRQNKMSGTAEATGKMIGIWNEDVALLSLFEAAHVSVSEVSGVWFFFRDFNYYNTVLKGRVGLFTSPLLAACSYLFLFYLGSAILFCPIMKDEAACPNRDSYDGWLTSIYFASVTMVRPFFKSENGSHDHN